MNSYHQTLYAGAVKVMANVIMIAAVFIAMYQSARSVASSELVFCAWFFGITVPVWAVAFRTVRSIRRRFPAEFQSLVFLPRHGQTLVRWRVAEPSLCPIRNRQ